MLLFSSKAKANRSSHAHAKPTHVLFDAVMGFSPLLLHFWGRARLISLYQTPLWCLEVPSPEEIPLEMLGSQQQELVISSVFFRAELFVKHTCLLPFFLVSCWTNDGSHFLGASKKVLKTSKTAKGRKIKMQIYTHTDFLVKVLKKHY